MATEHDVITDPDIHEPKDITTATSGQVYIADGSNSGAWSNISTSVFSSVGENKGRILVADGLGNVGFQESVFNSISSMVKPHQSGTGFPTRTAYVSNTFGWAFAINDEIDFAFRIPHDYDPGTDVHITIQWSHNGTNISGSAVHQLFLTYAKSHDQAVFPAEVQPNVTDSSLEIVGTAQYKNKLSVIDISDSAPSGTQIDTDDLEVDGLILGTYSPTTIPSVTAGSFFVHSINLVYKKGYFGTASKIPDFYS